MTTTTAAAAAVATRTIVRRPIRQRRQRLPQNDKLVWASRNNVMVIGVPDKERRYLNDFYTTLIDIRWRWNLLFFVVGFVLAWLVFALYYYFLCFLHGDLDPAHMEHNSTWTPCVTNVKSFTEAYLFSIETMSTIGYGWRQQTEECPGVFLAVIVQSVIGAGLQFALASLVVSKTRRANRISQTILFSNMAVVYQEDGHMKLAVRIGDMRKGGVIGAHATGMLIKKTLGKAGHKVPVRMFTVPFKAEGGKQKLFLCWPCLLMHSIDEHSAFWALSREQLQHELYELIVILDGVSATTSKPFQARKSYHTSEIMWGHRFKPLTITHDQFNSPGYVVNYTNFHLTYPSPVPLCSAQMRDRKRLLRELNIELKDDEDVDAYFSESPQRGDDATANLSSPLRGDGAGWAASASPQSETESRDEEKASEEGLDTPSVGEGGHLQGRTAPSPQAKSKQTEAETKETDSSTQQESLQTEPSSLTDSATSNETTLQPDASNGEPTVIIKPISTPAKDRARKLSRVEFEPLSLAKGTPPEMRKMSIGDAKNMYRHRRSVTDTYLGTELPEDDTNDSEASAAAILSIVTQQTRCPDGKPDARDKVRKKSTTQPLMFATEAGQAREAQSS